MEIRDNRAKEWFWLDNEYLNGYAKHLGVHCTAVYISLCRHADNETQTCFPSMQLIAEENGMSTKTVERGTKTLEKWGIISVKRGRGRDGKKITNVYTLLSKSSWKSKPTDSQSVGKPTDSEVKNQQTPVPYNNTHSNNNTHISEGKPSQEIVAVIDAFKEINPAYKKWFGNKTQRASTERLVKEHGLEQLLKVINILPITNKKRYMPTITTPLELEDKWAKLRSNLERIKEEKKELKAQVAF